MQVFLQRFLRAAQVATSTEYKYLEHLARYVLELALLDHSLLVYRTSTTAAAALFLSRLVLAKAERSAVRTREHVIWTRTMEVYTFHTAYELRDCVCHLHRLMLAASRSGGRTTAVRNKYLSKRRHQVANFLVLPAISDAVFQPYYPIAVPADVLGSSAR